MKRPDSIVQVSTMKCPDFENILKVGKWTFSGIKGLLRTISK
jgi:hypothetical protein